jgi:hypothetical protein
MGRGPQRRRIRSRHRGSPLFHTPAAPQLDVENLSPASPAEEHRQMAARAALLAAVRGCAK